MARGRKQAAEDPHANGTTVAEQPAPEAKAETNGNHGVVIKTFSYPVSKDTSVQALVKERIVNLQNGNTFTAHEVCVQKIWNTPTGEQKSLFTYRCSELYALQHAIARAESFILDLREESEPCPL